MAHSHRALVSLVFCTLSCSFAFAVEKPADKADKPEDWIASAKKFGLTVSEIEALHSNGLLVSGESFRQIFTPYIKSKAPLFITSDSLLNGFHVLYEESIIQLEKARARQLPGILRILLKSIQTVALLLDGDPKLIDAAKTRMEIVLCTALLLMGDKGFDVSPKVKQVVADEGKRIRKGKGIHKPSWLGAPDSQLFGLDYSRYVPRGFYTRSKRLMQYFRAMSWLQSIPFHVNRNMELLSILMLGHGLSYKGLKDSWNEEGVHAFLRRFTTFVGMADNWDVLKATRLTYSDLSLDDLAAIQRDLIKEAKSGRGPQINDQIRLPPGEDASSPDPTFRVISSHRTPDALLFHRTTSGELFKRLFPNGLEVCLLLGSDFARRRISEGEGKALLKVIEDSRDILRGRDLYCRYLRCLQALFDSPDPDAPDFMKGEVWEAKSCNTALAGWAQLRHAWILQAKQTAHATCVVKSPVGFVEPVPEFYGRLASLVEETFERLHESKAFEPDTGGLAAELRIIADFIKKHGCSGWNPMSFRPWNKDELEIMNKYGKPLFYLLERAKKGKYDFAPLDKNIIIEDAERFAGLLEQGIIPDDDAISNIIRNRIDKLVTAWKSISILCRQLEALAQKQLRGMPFNERENEIIKSFGKRLAKIMFYYGNSYLRPKDDALSIADVYFNPNVDIRRYMEVGIGRARALYVLYPFEDGKVLCKGAIMPYYEFRHDTRMTDAQWKILLSSEKKPNLPSWMKNVYSADTGK
jgi:hypothetical protein